MKILKFLIFLPFHNANINPYRQIPETISKKRAVTQGISRKLFPDFAILGRDSGDFPETILIQSYLIYYVKSSVS